MKEYQKTDVGLETNIKVKIEKIKKSIEEGNQKKELLIEETNKIINVILIINLINY